LRTFSGQIEGSVERSAPALRHHEFGATDSVMDGALANSDLRATLVIETDALAMAF
jgi:hypothetical protein